MVDQGVGAYDIVWSAARRSFTYKLSRM